MSIDSIVVLKGGIYSFIIGKQNIYRIRVECNKRFSLGKELWQPYILHDIKHSFWQELHMVFTV